MGEAAQKQAPAASLLLPGEPAARQLANNALNPRYASPLGPSADHAIVSA